MASPGLPVNIDSAYADDATHPDVKLHQGHHDVIHAFVNLFDDGDPPDGSIFFFNAGTGLFEAIDPGIAGSPGPTGPPGDDGVSFIWQGDWSSSTSYVVNDVVRGGDGVYICLANHSNSTPPSANWDLMASDGADGSTGSQGNPGVKGDTGAAGPAIEELEVFTSSGAALSFDMADFSYVVVTLDDDCTFDFNDSSSVAVNALTLRIYMGAGGPYTITWTDIAWANGATEPDLSGMAEGDLIVVTIDIVQGILLAYVPGAGTGGTPPPETFPTLDMEMLVQYSTNADAAAGANYSTPTSYQLGNKRGGLAWVSLGRDTTSPVTPTLSGGGASAWTLINTQNIGSGTTVRRVTLFAARDAVSGVASPLVVDLGGIAHTGVIIQVARSMGAVPDTFVATVAAKDVVATGSTNTPACTLAAGTGSDRSIFGWADNSPAQVYTPEAGYTILSALSINTPSLRAHVMWKSASFDTAPSGTTAAATVWGIIGTELVQG